MVEIMAVILLVIVWFVATGKSMDRFVNYGATDLTAWVFAWIVVWMSAWVINAMLEYERDNPCVLYESRLTLNAATKTMMPMRVCVERGEWEVGNE